jgi:hypothetical protein
MCFLDTYNIPKMQNDIGHKSKLGVLRQRGGKEAGGGGALAAMPCRAVTSRAVPGHAARRSAWRCVLHNWHKFTPDRNRRIRQRQRQKHHAGLDPTSFRYLIFYSTNCATLIIIIINNLFSIKMIITNAHKHIYHFTLQK